MSKIPNGVPTITYCRLLPSIVSIGQGDVMSDGNAVVVLEPGQPSSRFEVAQVLDKALTDEEVCELTFGSRAGSGMGAVLSPISAFVNDAANVVILLTGSRMTKKWQFLKRCLLPFIANEVLSTVSDRSQHVPSNLYKAQLTLSAFEIHDEIIGDLLRPVNRGHPIVPTLEEGVVVQGLHKETIVDEVTLRRLLAEACDNRAVQGLPVGGNIDTSTGVFEFRLYQSEPGRGVGPNAAYQTQDCYSRLVVLDLPAMDPLAPGADDVRLLSGPSLHKSLITFADVAKKLNNPYRAQLAPFRASKLTHYLSEMLGGNAVVVALASVSPGEPAVSRRTLDLVSSLNTAVHYPMGARELSDSLRGLLGKYRAMLMHVSDDLTAQSATLRSKDDEQTQLITRLQREVAVAVSEMQTAVEDRARIFEVSELLKAKYQTVMSEKLRQSEELAQAEEDNIALAREIVESELSHSQAVEQADKEKLALQSTIVQQQAHIDSLLADVEGLASDKERYEAVIRKSEEDQELRAQELAAVHRDLQQALQTAAEQREKNVELGAELLTLVNRKDLVEKEAAEARAQLDGLTRTAEDATRGQAEGQVEIRRLLEKVVAKDEEILALRKKCGLDSVLAASASDESLGNVVRAVDTMRAAVENKRERELVRQQQHLEKTMQRLDADLAAERKEKQQLKDEVKRLRDKYRQQLEEGYAPGPSPGHAQQVPGQELVADSERGILEEQQMDLNLQSLLESYHRREKELEAEVAALQGSRAEVIVAYRDLYDHYRAMLDTVEDMLAILSDPRQKDKKGALDARGKKIIEEGLREQFKFARALLQDADTQLGEMEDPRSRRFPLRDVPSDQEQSDMEKNERIAAVLATFQRNLQQSEAKLAQTMQENVDLRIQIKQLLNPSRQQPPTAGTAAAANPIVYQQALEQQATKLSDQYGVMYQNLTSEIMDLKKQLLASRVREREKDTMVHQARLASRSASGTPVAALPSLMGELDMPVLRTPSAPSSVEKGDALHASASAQRFARAVNHFPEPQSAPVVPVAAAVAPVRPEDRTALQAQLQASEQRAAQMASKQVQLEEELRAYQTYMRDILPQYQRMLKERGRSELRPSAASMAAAKEILKLPSVQTVQQAPR